MIVSPVMYLGVHVAFLFLSKLISLMHTHPIMLKKLKVHYYHHWFYFIVIVLMNQLCQSHSGWVRWDDAACKYTTFTKHLSWLTVSSSGHLQKYTQCHGYGIRSIIIKQTTHLRNILLDTSLLWLNCQSEGANQHLIRTVRLVLLCLQDR